MTQDGYDLHYMLSADLRDVSFENEIFYYQPDFDAIMNAIDNLRYAGEAVTLHAMTLTTTLTSTTC